MSLDALHWSLPLVVMQEEIIHIPLWKATIRIEIRGYEEGSRFLVIFRRGSSSGPYRYNRNVYKCIYIVVGDSWFSCVSGCILHGMCFGFWFCELQHLNNCLCTFEDVCVVTP